MRSHTQFILQASISLFLIYTCHCHDQLPLGENNAEHLQKTKQQLLQDQIVKICNPDDRSCIEAEKAKIKRGTEDWWFQYFQKQFNKYPSANTDPAMAPLSLKDTIVNMGGITSNHEPPPPPPQLTAHPVQTLHAKAVKPQQGFYLPS